MSLAVWYLTISTLGIIWSFSSLLLQLKSAKVLLATDKGEKFESAYDRNMGVGFAFGSAMIACIAMMCVKESLSADSQNSGPLLAVVSSDVLIAAVYCHFVFKERLSMLQWCAVALLLSGIVVMTVAPDQRREGDNVENGAPIKGDFLVGFAWAVAAAIGFAGTNLFTKYAFTYKMHAGSFNLMRMSSMFICGIVVLTVALLVEDQKEWFPSGQNGEDVNNAVSVWCFNVLQGVIKMFGLLCLTMLLTFECTAVGLSIVGGGAATTGLLLNLIIEQFPGDWKIVGFTMVIIGVAAMPILATTQRSDSEENEGDEKNESNMPVYDGVKSEKVESDSTLEKSEIEVAAMDQI